MQLFFTILEKCVVMCAFMAIGYFLCKKKIFTEVGSREISNFLMVIITPCSVFQAFLKERTAERIRGFGISILLSLAAMLVFIVISTLVFGKQRIERFCCSFSNVGFLGLALVMAILGSEQVFFVSFFSVMTGVVGWTWGIYIVTGNKRYIRPRVALLSPNSIALALSLAIFLSGLGTKMPALLTGAVSSLASMSAPLSMITMGCYLASVELKSVLLNRRNWLVCFVHLFVCGAAVAVLFRFVPERFADVRQAVYLAAIAPVATLTASVSSLFGEEGDGGRAVSLVSLSTLLSTITVPIMMLFAQFIWSL